MRCQASCSATNIFRECDDPGSASSSLILFPVEMGFRLVVGIDTFLTLVCGIGVSRTIISRIVGLRIGDSAVLRICEKAMVRYGLRVLSAETRLTVHRPHHFRNSELEE